MSERSVHALCQNTVNPGKVVDLNNFCFVLIENNFNSLFNPNGLWADFAGFPSVSTFTSRLARLPKAFGKTGSRAAP